MSQVKNNAVFAISVDGSNDSNSQLYPIVIVYFDRNEEKIKSSLLALAVLTGNFTGQNIGKLVLNTLEAKKIDMKNCIAFSADNVLKAPVMIGIKNGVTSIFKEKMELS